jgi:hypothetical protein
MKEKWQKIIEQRLGYDHPDYPVSEWKRAVFNGWTRLGYADVVSTKLTAERPPLPKELLMFRPKTTLGKSVQRAVVTEFEENGAAFVKKENGHGWFAMRCAFEHLIPFVVAKGEDSFVIAKDTSENRSDLRELGAEILYEWDGYAVPRYEDM